MIYLILSEAHIKYFRGNGNQDSNVNAITFKLSGCDDHLEFHPVLPLEYGHFPGCHLILQVWTEFSFNFLDSSSSCAC